MSSDSEHFGKILRSFFHRPDIPARRPERKANSTTTSLHKGGSRLQLTLDETVEALSKWDKSVLEAMYHFEHDPYPSVAEKIEGIDEPISPRPMSVSPVPEYMIAGVLWPHDPRSSFRALLKFGLAEQPQSCNHCSVHCHLPDGRILLVDYKGGAFDARRPDVTSFDVTVYLDGLHRFGRHGVDDLRFPNSYTLTSTGIFVARKTFGIESTQPEAGTATGASSSADERPDLASDLDAELAELEYTTPPLNQRDGTWVKSKTAASLEGVQTETLASYRSRGIKNRADNLGRDVNGRIWRREGTPHSHPWYLRSSLTSAKKSLVPNHGKNH